MVGSSAMHLHIQSQLIMPAADRACGHQLLPVQEGTLFLLSLVHVSFFKRKKMQVFLNCRVFFSLWLQRNGLFSIRHCLAEGATPFPPYPLPMSFQLKCHAL